LPKKKRKTRKEKQLSEKRREDYIKNVNKTENEKLIEKKDSAKIKEASPAEKTMSQVEIKEDFTVSNIKRALVYALVFFGIIIVLYILEQRFNFFSDWASGIMDRII
jgi:hypothetical protein